MLLRLKNYDELYSTFEWQVPDYYNIATDTVDKDAYKNRTALINILDDGKTENWSFLDIKISADKLANAFDYLKLESNARVGIILGQCPEAAISHMACFKSGRISIPLFNLFGVDALYYRLMNSKASLVICDQATLIMVKEIYEKLPNLTSVICIDGDYSEQNIFNFKKLLEKSSNFYETKKTKSSDPISLGYTSGTTGGPKGALLPHRVLLGHIPGVEMPHEFLSSVDPVQDIFWTPADWAWIGGLFDVLLPAWHFGIPVVSYRSGKFDPEFAFYLLSKFKVRNTFLPPTALKMMKAVNLSKNINGLNLRTVGSGGEALGEELLEWGNKILGVGINEFYGQTECNLTVSNNGAIMPSKQGSIGKPVPGHIVRLMDKNKQFINKSGCDGEIVVKYNTGDCVMKGYWRDEKTTSETIVDGWLHTGDIASIDEDGYFYFKGREDDIINSSGYRIGPSEVEDCILSHSEVDMVAVIGVPDKIRGQIILAFMYPSTKSNVRSK